MKSTSSPTSRSPLDRANDLAKVACRHLAAQQHLATDDDRCDRAGVALGQRDRDVGEMGVLRAIAPDPDPEQHLQSDLRSEFRHLVEPLIDRISADAFGDLGEFGQILRDLLGANDQRRIMRGLLVAERCIGDAFELGRAIDRRTRQRYRRGEPPPHRGNQAQRYHEKRQRRAKADRPAPKSVNIFACLAVRRRPVDPLAGIARPIARGHRTGDIRIASDTKHQT